MRTSLKRLILVAAFAIGTGVSFPAIAAAQPHRHPGGGHGHGAVVVAPYYPYYPFGVGFGWGYGYGPWWPAPYPYYGYPYGYPTDPDGSLKLEVKPRTAEVYVDGYYAGLVDNFDGTFQRLHTSPGEHEITLYQDGFRTVHQKLYVQPNVTTKLKYAMEQLTAGEQPEARPQPPNPPPDQGQQLQPRGAYPPPRGQQPPYQGPPYQGPPQGQPPQGQPRQGSAPPNQQIGVNVYGTIAIRVQPGGADIVVDGERWNGPEGQERVFIEVPEGRHTVEIHKQGFRGYVTEIDVRPGETASLNVSLRSQEDQ